MITGGRFVCKPTGALVLAAWATAFCPVLGADQFSASFPLAAGGDEMASSGISGAVAQPAREKASAAQKRISADLNTRQLCGRRMRTQAVLVFSYS
jgi:hypothetical protein